MTDTATVAADLRRISDMATRLQARAIDRANDRDYPGGEALVLLAGVGSRETWERRVELAEADGDYDKGNSEDPERMWSALQLLWYWSESIRRTLGHDHDDPRWRPTLASEAAILRNRDVADWIWGNETNWDDYAKDVRAARRRLEDVLVEGERAERTRVVCGNPDCDNPRTLIRVYARKHPVEWTCDACGHESGNPEPCDRCQSDSLRETWWESDDADDRWKCTTCKTTYDHTQLQKLYGDQLRHAAHDKWVPVTHAIQLLKAEGTQERVVRRWLYPDPDPEKAKRQKPPPQPIQMRRNPLNRRDEVLWSDIWTCHSIRQNSKRANAQKEAS